jgi:hypothetical protein
MRGHVVIAGLGMGLALYNALLRPAVRRVTVIERDPEMIALFEEIRGSEWPVPERFAIELADALGACEISGRREPGRRYFSATPAWRRPVKKVASNRDWTFGTPQYWAAFNWAMLE